LSRRHAGAVVPIQGEVRQVRRAEQPNRRPAELEGEAGEAGPACSCSGRPPQRKGAASSTAPYSIPLLISGLARGAWGSGLGPNVSTMRPEPHWFPPRFLMMIDPSSH